MKHLSWTIDFAISNLQKWRGYAYPDKNNLSKFIELGEFKSEDECNAAAVNTLRRVSSLSAGDYECHRH